MGYSYDSNGDEGQTPIGERLSALPLFCPACRALYYHFIPGFLTRVNGIIHFFPNDGSPPERWEFEGCAYCGNRHPYLWAVL